MWRGAPLPERRVLEGRYARLEPLDPAQHSESLYEAASAPGAEARFRYLFELPPTDLAEVKAWAEQVVGRADPLFFAVVDRQTGRAEGRQSLMRIDAPNGVIEVGSIMWGPRLSRTRMATEAIFLFADYIFSLGYRRFEWKCNDLNAPSKSAAQRFGFRYEGTFRQHMVLKGQNRDTAWFSMLDSDWPRLRPAYLDWLRPENFDADGRQLTALRVPG